jgi:membrane-associated phospholipid phosphatase
VLSYLYDMIGWGEKIVEWLIAADRNLFRIINGHLSCPAFDGLLPLWRTPEFWTPLYLFLIVFMWTNFRKAALWWMLYFVVTVSTMDLIGNKLIKQTVQRIRPCNDPSIFPDLILRIPHCGTGYSFISNHAANHFALAMFAFLTLGAVARKWRWLFFVWAFSIGWAQIYVGVHYPFDVLAGAFVGILMGGIMATLFNRIHQRPIFDTATTSLP